MSSPTMTCRPTRPLLLVLTLFVLGMPGLGEDVQADQAPPSGLPDAVTDDPLLNSRFVLFGDRLLRKKTLRWATRGRRKDMVAPLIYSLRYLAPNQRPEVVEALQKITNQNIGDEWLKWMQWQQANKDVRPFEGFDIFLSALFAGLDPDFKQFVYPGVQARIRLEEVVWGGVRAYDGIPPLDHPTMINAPQAAQLSDKELVFGIAINGDVRAYPYRYMDWHEMLNDTIGGQPVSLAYCTLCGSGILFDTSNGANEPRQFGSSGLLYQSNKLMYDRKTNSLWNQFTGEPVIGKLAKSGVQLARLPLVTTTWGEWRQRHPQTRVVDPDTGFDRNYRPGAPYGDYFKSGTLMFPTLTNDRSLRQKEQVFGLQISGANKAWALKTFKGGKVINDQLGVLKVVLVGDSKSRNVRAYRRGNYRFEKQGRQLTQIVSLESGQSLRWQVTEDALIADNGESLSRLPGHLAFWFAWHNYVGGETLSKIR